MEKIVQIQISAENDVKGSDGFSDYVRRVVESALSHFSDRITRIEIHIGDENGRKHGQNDKRCMMEARVEGRQPTAVTDYANTFEHAVEGAAKKMKHSLEATFDRLRDRSEVMRASHDIEDSQGRDI